MATAIHPNLLNHSAMNGGGGAARAAQENAAEPVESIVGLVDRRVSRNVAATLLAAAALLFVLRASGFRFSMGVGGG